MIEIRNDPFTDLGEMFLQFLARGLGRILGRELPTESLAELGLSEEVVLASLVGLLALFILYHRRKRTRQQAGK